MVGIETNEADLMLVECKEFRSSDLFGKPLKASYEESIEFIEDNFIDIAFIEAEQFDSIAKKMSHNSIVVILNTSLKIAMDLIAKKNKFQESRIASFTDEYMIYNKPDKLEEDVNVFTKQLDSTVVSVVQQFSEETTSIFIGSRKLLKSYVFLLMTKRNVIMPIREEEDMIFIFESLKDPASKNRFRSQQELF